MITSTHGTSSNPRSNISFVFDVCFVNIISANNDPTNKDKIDALTQAFQSKNTNKILLTTPFLGEFLYYDSSLTNLFHILGKLNNMENKLDNLANETKALYQKCENNMNLPISADVETPHIAPIISERIKFNGLNKGFIFRFNENDIKWNDLRKNVYEIANKLQPIINNCKIISLNKDNVFGAEQLEYNRAHFTPNGYAREKIDFQSRAIIYHYSQYSYPIIFSNDTQMKNNIKTFFPAYETSEIDPNNPQKIFMNISTGGTWLPTYNATPTVTTNIPNSIQTQNTSAGQNTSYTSTTTNLGHDIQDQNALIQQSENYRQAIFNLLGKNQRNDIHFLAPALLAFCETNARTLITHLSNIHARKYPTKKDPILPFDLNSAIAFSLLFRKLSNNIKTVEKNTKVTLTKHERKFYLQLLAILIMNPNTSIYVDDETGNRIKDTMNLVAPKNQINSQSRYNSYGNNTR